MFADWASAMNDFLDHEEQSRPSTVPPHWLDSKNAPPGADTVAKAIEFLDRVGKTLREKNRAYGDSAANPVRIFSKADPVEAIRVRIDDKISRIKRGGEFMETEDVILDLVGYLALLVAATEGKK